MGTQLADALKQVIRQPRVIKRSRPDNYPGGAEQRVYDNIVFDLDTRAFKIAQPCMTKGCIWKHDMQPS